MVQSVPHFDFSYLVKNLRLKIYDFLLFYSNFVFYFRLPPLDVHKYAFGVQPKIFALNPFTLGH